MASCRPKPGDELLFGYTIGNALNIHGVNSLQHGALPENFGVNILSLKGLPKSVETGRSRKVFTLVKRKPNH